jgi:hypothetical protein
LRRNGLEIDRLEAEGRFCWSEAIDPLEERETALGRILSDAAHSGVTVWAGFNWTREVNFEQMVAQQEHLASFVDAARLVVKTAAIESVAEDWSPAALRQAQSTGRGLIRIGYSGLVLSRAMPLPPS